MTTQTVTPWPGTTGIEVAKAPPPIPFGCICSYTWAALPGRLARNGALASCPADHSEVDAA